MAAVASPCINVCQINEATQQCLGCYRTVEEITNWWDMSVDEQRAFLVVLEQREIEALNFG